MSQDLEFLKELINGFLLEADDLFKVVENRIAALRQNPQDRAAVDDLYEAAHTIRMQAGFFDFDSLSEVALGVERLLGQVRQDALALEVPETDLLLEAQGCIEDGIAQLRAYDTSPLGVADLLARLQFAAESGTLIPEAQIAAIDSAGEENDLPEYEDDEVAGEIVPEIAAEIPEATPTKIPDPAAIEVKLEEVEVEEGPIGEETMDFVPDFLTEGSEILDKLDEDLVRLEDTSDDLDLLNEIFRAAHTIKGTSAFLGFGQMAELTHKMENVLDLLRKGEMQLNQNIMDVILQAVDQIKAFMEDIRNNNIVRHDIDDLRRALLIIFETKGASLGAAAPAAEKPAPASSAAAEEMSAAAAPTAQAAGGAASRTPAREADQVIRVDLDRIDKIMTLAEELVLGRNRLLQLNTQLLTDHGEDELVNRLNEATGQVGMLTGELQESVMMMRMIPASRVFSRFPRMVRDLARDLGKQIDLVIEDNDTELDKSVADEIGDPLIHLIRNAVDHGVETPQERAAAGKEARGTVLLSAAHEGNHIVIRIRDDGKGMDPQKLKQKAVEKGVLSEADAERMHETDAYSLIFAPGFSLAKEITDVSGRGVGMDVVKTNITRLSGTIDLDSKLGEGTEVTIRLPLTLAIIGGLQVNIGDEVFIIPQTSVEEALKVDEAEIESLRGRKVIMVRGKVLPLIDLRQILEIEDEESEHTSPYLVVVGLAERRVGIVVDQLLGQVDVVIKALGEIVGPATGIAGATILGDGRVRLILDVGELIDIMDRSTTNSPAHEVVTATSEMETEMA